MKALTSAVLMLTLATAPATMAQEAIQTHSGESPRAEAPAEPIVGPDRDRRQANGDWARKVMAGETTREDAEDEGLARGCDRNLDRNPHGEVWVGVGTGGYKTAGAVVTQPIGDCTEVTVAVSKTDGGRIRRGRR